MAAPILATKLYIPPPRLKSVLRPRLVQQLNNDLDQPTHFNRKLTLVSAPAGFGKTTLVSEWLHGQGKPTAWLSLDGADSDPNRFLAYLIATLQSITPDIGERTLSLLQSPQPQPLESTLTFLLNEIAANSASFFLVLDDYHVIDSVAIDQIVAFLLEHLPPQIHLILATREDPNLPLPRLRVRGQMLELRASDLRFTQAETADFLRDVMNITLDTAAIAALESRTEGWAAGLQMAALSMQGQADQGSFIDAFTGSHRFVLDYLVEEVLQSQPKLIRDFLLQTAVLTRLSAPLCTALTDQQNARDLLATLDRNNLFLIPLDNQRDWYRYHHLFADVLQARALDKDPALVPTLHQKASRWYEVHDFPADAIHHALAAQDFERAAGLIELARETMDQSMQSATWLSWVKQIPDALLEIRPVLSVGYAWALLDTGQLEASEARLQAAEKWLGETAVNPSSSDMVVTDQSQFPFLPASIAVARAYRALALGDVAETTHQSQLALSLTTKNDQRWRVAAISLLGLAQYASGDLVAADQSLTGFLNNMWQANRIAEAISITFILANIKITLGRLQEAKQLYHASLQQAVGQGKPYPIGTADLYRGLSEINHEQGNHEQAIEQLQLSEKLGAEALLTDWESRLRVTQARVRQSAGDLAEAVQLLNEAERLHVRSPLPDVRPIAAQRARVWLKQGKLTEAQAWAQRQQLSSDDMLTYVREFEHLTLAHTRLAQTDQPSSFHQATTIFLEKLYHAAKEGARVGSLIELLTLQAISHKEQDHIDSALQTLEEALALAEPEGFQQIFVDAGTPIAQLLTKLKHPNTQVQTYAQRLLGKFVAQELFAASQENSLHHDTLIEPLSQRELEVLQLIAQGLSNREISERLFLALSTVKGHNRILFGKLHVQRRTEAVARARELGLL
ncbi:MAG: LuxR C-terminal-related transcriptional regulator [Chloroflexota bacterium]